MGKKDTRLIRTDWLPGDLGNHPKSSETENHCKTGLAQDIGNPFDRKNLFANVDNDLEFLQELCELFISCYPSLMAELGRAIQDGHAQRAQAAAHQLKGMVANFAAGTATTLSREIENLAKDGKLHNLHRPFQSLEKELTRLKAALETTVMAAAGASEDRSTP